MSVCESHLESLHVPDEVASLLRLDHLSEVLSERLLLHQLHPVLLQQPDASHKHKVKLTSNVPTSNHIQSRLEDIFCSNKTFLPSRNGHLLLCAAAVTIGSSTVSVSVACTLYFCDK